MRLHLRARLGPLVITQPIGSRRRPRGQGHVADLLTAALLAGLVLFMIGMYVWGSLS